LSRRGRSLPANASGFDTHRDSISSCFDCRRRQHATALATLALQRSACLAAATPEQQQRCERAVSILESVHID
jgi:hypothetical protein